MKNATLSNVPVQETNSIISTYDKMHFELIRLVHETLFGLFVNPFDKLSAAGLKEGQEILEVGCGPGYFSIPAAEIAGDKGHVTSIDINPAAVEYLRKKIQRLRAKNVEAVLADASATGLPDGSFDVAFLFGVVHAFPRLDDVLREMHRVLKPNGKLCIQSRRSADEIVETVKAEGMFQFQKKDREVNVFVKVVK
jgi:ubiquinone/menaquinone biosynthesis C-methylase UbiE